MKLSLFTTVTALALTTPTYAIQDEEPTHAVAKAIESYENYLFDVKGEDVDIMKMVATSKSNKVSVCTYKSAVFDHIL